MTLFTTLSITQVSSDLPSANCEVRFIADSMLGTLARKLRILGLDTEYYPDADMGEIMYRCRAESRILLTKNRKLADTSHISTWLVRGDGYWEEFLSITGLLPKSGAGYSLFSRCSVCNGCLTDVSGGSVKEKVPPHVLRTRSRIMKCSGCARVYWKGTHWNRMNREAARMIERLVK
ncbi:MAG: Mut7-C RNAse domain-containing protein [bacterium]